MKICKQLLSVLLVMALTLGIFGTFAVSAEGTPSVSLDVNEVVVDEEAGVYKLVFKMTATDVSVLGASIVFSYDTSMIQPVRKDTLADVNVTVSSTDTALKRVFSAFANDDYEFEFAPFAKAERENRMGLKVDTYSTDAYTPDGEMVFTEFYYRIKDGATPNKDAIRLETDFSDGSILKEMYPNPDEAAAVAINTGTTTGFFKYGAVNTGNNTAVPLKSFTHSGTVVTSIRTVPNTLMQMEEDSFSTVVGSVGGSGDYFSLVMPDAVAEKLGINPQDVYGGVVTAGTPYDGLYMSGHIYVKDAAWVYTVADELTNLQKQSNIALKNGPTDVTFENVRISRMRRSSGGSLVIEAKRSEFADGVTSAKKYAGTVNLDSLTETTKITKEEVAMDPATIDKATFLAIADPYWANNLVITKGEEYIDTMDLDVEPFTADTLFLSMDRSHVYADAMKANTWTTASLGGWNVWYRAADSSGAIQGDQTGPYQVVVPKVSGEYKVYALKYGHGTSAKKAKVDINGNQYSYNSLSGTGVGAWGVFWDVPATTKGQDTVTLTAGVPIYVGDVTYKGDSYAQGGLLALAFVPVDQANDITLSADNNAKAEIISNANINCLNAIDFSENKAKTYTIKLKDSTEAEAPEAVDYSVKPYFRRSHTYGSTAWPYTANSMVRHPTGYATVADLMTQFLVETKGLLVDDIWSVAISDTYQVYVNGIREYRPNQKLIMPGDVVEIKKDPVTSANFNPLGLGTYAHHKYYVSGSAVRFGLKAGDNYINKNTFPHLYSGDKTTPGTYPTDTFFAGYMIRTSGEYVGQKIYFPLATLTSKNNDVGSAKDFFLPNVAGYNGTNANNGVDNTIVVETPEGTQTVLDPYKLTTGDSVSTGAYDVGGLYWVNSTTTNDVRYEKVDDEYVLRTDGFVLIRVITKKADGTVKTVRTELTPGKSYVFKPAAGETVYVWEDTAYNGTTVRPLFPAFTAE